MNLVLFNVKGNIGLQGNENDYVIVDQTLFAYDIDTKVVYDSLTYDRKLSTFNSIIVSKEDVILMLSNNSVLS